MKQNNIFKKALKLFYRAKEVSEEKGICHIIRFVIKTIINRATNLFPYSYYKLFKSKETFIFQRKSYHYFYTITGTWKHERAVEVPIIWEIVKKYQGKKILEVGNVLANYFPVNHDIVDKYDKSTGVINQDVVDFQPAENEKYDLIVSISTIEHVGWDEKPRDPKKIPRALENLTTKCLAPGGEIVVTLPIGYNSYLDKLLKEDKIRFNKQYYLKRISKDNKWIEVDWSDICDAKFGDPFPYSNGLVIGIIERK